MFMLQTQNKSNARVTTTNFKHPGSLKFKYEYELVCWRIKWNITSENKRWPKTELETHSKTFPTPRRCGNQCTPERMKCMLKYSILNFVKYLPLRMLADVVVAFAVVVVFQTVVVASAAAAAIVAVRRASRVALHFPETGRVESGSHFCCCFKWV